MIEIRKIKDKEEFNYANKEAEKNGHSVPYATHVLYNKDGDVVGLWSLATMPVVLAWSHTDKMNKIDSIYSNETMAALMDEKGYSEFFIACEDNSPYYKHMSKFGYEDLNWNTSLFRKTLK